jgi:phosphate:Na+ symporter
MIFSESLEKNAAQGIRTLFKKVSDNRFAAFGVGVGATAVTQSSTATTVMTVGLVNAGIITLFQATAIIMGAKVGTTLTAIIISLSALDIRHFFMLLAFIGAAVKIIVKKGKIRNIADLLMGFGIIFVGLSLMSSAFRDNEAFRNSVINLFEIINNPLLLILVGAVFTVITQSSTATMGIILAALSIVCPDTGAPMPVIEFTSAMYLAMGATMGTCSTAIFTSLSANSNAKRAAFIPLIFCTISVAIFTAILWPLGGRIIPYYTNWITSPVWQLSIYNLVYNILAMMIMIWFIKPLNALGCRIIKDKDVDDGSPRTSYIDDRLLNSPAIAIEQTKKEIIDMAERVRDNLVLGFEALIHQDITNMDDIYKREDYIDFLNKAVGRFVTKLSSTSVNTHDDMLIGSFIHVSGDMERIGDYAMKMLADAGLMKKLNATFSKRAVIELRKMFSKVLELFTLSLEIFEHRDTGKLKALTEMEEEIDLMKFQLAEAHKLWLKSGQHTVIGGGYFYSAVTYLERIGNRLANLAFTAKSFADEDPDEYQLLDLFEEMGGEDEIVRSDE